MFRLIFNFAALILFFAAYLSFVPAQTSPSDGVFTGNRSANTETAVRADFDGDGKSDISVFRRSTGFWHVLKSSGGTQSVQWGMEDDWIIPGDFDGDRRTDFAVYRFGNFYNGQYDSYYYILRSSDNSFQFRQWGRATGFTGDAPTAPADFDGDGKTDYSTHYFEDTFSIPAYFKYLRSSDGVERSVNWGYTGDSSVAADYDGDGKADIAVFRRFSVNQSEQGVWFILRSSDNIVRVERFGAPADRTVPADYDGDGKADIAVWRSSNGFWYRINSHDNSMFAAQFGQLGDIPVPADYDGDGKTDIGVYRGGIWYLQRSRDGFLAQPFGADGDTPVQSRLY